MNRTQDEIAKWREDHGLLKMSLIDQMDATLWMLTPIVVENESLRQVIKVGRGVPQLEESRKRLIERYKIRQRLLKLICKDTVERAQRLCTNSLS